MNTEYLTAEIASVVPLTPGTYRLRGGSNFRGIGTLAEAHLHAENQCYVIPVLLSGQGRFFELIHVPEPVSRVTLSVKLSEHSSETLQLESVELKSINRLVRYWTYLTVALATWYRLPRSQRYHHNLFWYSAHLNPKRAYQSVQQYRFKYGTLSYDEWVAQVDHLSVAETGLIKRFSQRLLQSGGASPTLLMDARGCSRWDVESSLVSVRDSFLQPEAVYVLVDSTEAIDRMQPLSVDDCRLSWVLQDQLAEHLSGMPARACILWLPAGCRLAPHALSWFASEWRKQSEVTCIYSDHDYVDGNGRRHSPCFKPDWSDELAFSSGYPGWVLCVAPGSILECLSSAAGLTAYRLMLFAAALRTSNVAHLPGILWHAPEGRLVRDDLEGDCLQQFLDLQHRDARVSRDADSGCLRIHDALPDPKPLVSIIIPTRDRLDLLIPCVESVLNLTTYAPFEVLILDNQSEEAATHAYFQQVVADARVRVIPFDHPFNYAAINNYAATQAKGSLLCLLNNDTEVLSPDWLSEMVSTLHLPRVGAVGAQLRYPNGRLQHAGDLVGGSGCANHLFGPLEPGDLGYMQRAGLRQDLSAVTAACLLTCKSLYQLVGGLDQRRLKVAFNDVDYCLRVREAGYRVMYTPYAKLIHYESESRGADISSQKRRRSLREAQYMRRRWAHVMQQDPFYNPNLNYYRCDFSLDPAPVIKKPWDD